MRHVSRSRWGYLVLAVVAGIVCSVVGYAIYVLLPPLLHGTACEARTAAGTVRLTPEQAANAATIAAVAVRKELPQRAVTIALATAYQESKLRNLPDGDRDSIGLFQQRPSQGWGEPDQLHDPVYAATKFYDALVRVHGYRTLPLYQAAQRVQRSADGTAYAQHEEDAQVLASVLTGREPGGFRCWSRDGGSREPGPGAVRERLTRQFGDLPLRSSVGELEVPVSTGRYGWAVASWAVAHAEDLGVASVAYAGKVWVADYGYDGWGDAEAASKSRVRIKVTPPG